MSTDAAFTFRVKNTFNFARPCTNCKRSVPAFTEHICEAFTDDRALVSERAAVLRAERIEAGATTGFCHCNGFFRGSDHCQCCGCEEHEGTCTHVCDGVGCMFEHDERGRIT